MSWVWQVTYDIIVTSDTDPTALDRIRCVTANFVIKTRMHAKVCIIYRKHLLDSTGPTMFVVRRKLWNQRAIDTRNAEYARDLQVSNLCYVK